MSFLSLSTWTNWVFTLIETWLRLGLEGMGIWGKRVWDQSLTKKICSPDQRLLNKDYNMEGKDLNSLLQINNDVNYNVPIT